MARPKLRELPDLSSYATIGAAISVKVTPKAAKDGIFVENNVIRISVAAPPENGKANRAVRRILAAAMQVAPSRLILKRGQTSRDNVFVYAS